MKKLNLFLVLFALIMSIGSFAQQKVKGRGLCQQEYIIHAFIEPQLKKGPFQVKKPGDIDSLFMAMEVGWQTSSADSLKKYPSELTPTEYSQLDAYCYFWALASITQNLDAGTAYRKTLIGYMINAMLRDEAILKRSGTPYTIDMIHGGNLGNTLSIGSVTHTDKAIFEKTYQVFNDFMQLFTELSLKPDTVISHAATVQLKTLRAFYYPMHATNAYFEEDYDKAFNYLLTGLNIDRYPKSRAFDLTQKLVNHYAAEGDKDKCYTLLNTLALNTTADNLNRDTLATLYARVDAGLGPVMYDNLKKKLSTSSFKTSGKAIKLPTEWAFIANNIPKEKLQKAKYILADFWYTGCAPCIEEVPELNILYNKLKQRDDVIFLSVNTDYVNGKQSKDYVAKRSADLKVDFPIYYDEPKLAINKQLNVSGYPSKFIITTKGEVLEKTDRSDMTLASFETFLKEQK